MRSLPTSSLPSIVSTSRGTTCSSHQRIRPPSSAARSRSAYSAGLASSAYFVRGQKKPRRPSPLVRGTTCRCRCGDALADGVVHRHEGALGAEAVDHRGGEPLAGLQERVPELGGQVGQGDDVPARHQQHVALEHRAGCRGSRPPARSRARRPRRRRPRRCRRTGSRPLARLARSCVRLRPDMPSKTPISRTAAMIATIGADDVELGEAAGAERVGDHAADERADDAEEQRHEQREPLLAGLDQARESADDEPEHEESDDRACRSALRVGKWDVFDGTPACRIHPPGARQTTPPTRQPSAAPSPRASASPRSPRCPRARRAR